MGNIEILVIRDPDSETILRVYLDGVLTNDYTQYDVDPGAGYVLSEWREETDDVRQRTDLSEAFRVSIVQSRILHEDFQYIEDDTEEPIKTWTFFGHWENDRIVIEYTLEGVNDDERRSTGHWEEGLFAASASGATVTEAEAVLRDEYDFTIPTRGRATHGTP